MSFFVLIYYQCVCYPHGFLEQSSDTPLNARSKQSVPLKISPMIKYGARWYGSYLSIPGDVPADTLQAEGTAKASMAKAAIDAYLEKGALTEEIERQIKGATGLLYVGQYRV